MIANWGPETRRGGDEDVYEYMRNGGQTATSADRVFPSPPKFVADVDDICHLSLLCVL